MKMPSSYIPRSAFERWLDRRLPVLRLIHDQFVVYPTPRNLNFWWAFGAVLTLVLGLQIATGIVLAMHYVPSTAHAFESVERIKRDVPSGWLIQSLHATGASMFFLAAYIHILRSIYYGSYKSPREITWILGMLIYVTMIVTAFLGYTLPWGQMSFWGATVITSVLGAIPLVGDGLVSWIRGGGSIDQPTLNRFYSLHYLLPFVLTGLVVLHIWALHETKQSNPEGKEIQSPAETVPFTPNATIKDLFITTLFLVLFAFFVFFLPHAFSEPDNSIPANPLSTPAEIVPEWYLLPFYAILRAFDFNIGPLDSKTLGVLAMFASIAVPFVLPWLDAAQKRSMRYRPWARRFFLAFVVATLALGWCGAQSPTRVLWQSSPYRIEGALHAPGGVAQTVVVSATTRDEADTLFEQMSERERAAGHALARTKTSAPIVFAVTQLSVFLTLCYFAFFVLVLPLLARSETRKAAITSRQPVAAE